MANLFASQTPAVADASDGAPGIATATTVRFAVAGQVTGVRFYATTTVSGTYTAQLYEVTAADVPTGAGALLAEKVSGVAPTGGTWNTVLFDTPVSVTASTKLYRAAIHSGAGRYVATTSFFGSDLVNGDITADANGDDPVGLGTLRNGTFSISATPAYPASGGGTCYFVDVEFTADGAGPVTPNSLRTGITLGAPTVTNRLTVRPDALRTGIRPGAPAVTTPAPEPGSASGGDWDGYGAVLAYAREQHRINQERLRNPVECLHDGWPLIRTSRGYYCEFGGHIVAPPV